MGYYLSMGKQCRDNIFVYSYYLKALLFPVILHGMFDYILLQGGRFSYLSSPMLIFLVLFLETLLAKSQTMMAFDVLRGMKVRFEDWLTINRQSRYERWIMRSMGLPGVSSEPFFFWRPGFIRFLLVIGFIAFSLTALSFRQEFIELLSLTISNNEQIILLGVFPASLALIVILVGAINPEFFRNSEIKMPIISDVEIETDYGIEETFISYDISSANCFLRTSEPLGMRKEVTFRFSLKGFVSDELTGYVVWENHIDRMEPFGTIIGIKNRNRKFIFGFLFKYHLYRLYKGMIFLLKLPGFEQTRMLFMRPVTTMQKEKYYAAGDIVYREGDAGNDFYLLKKGSVVFYKKTDSGETITLDTANEGQTFGEMAILGEKIRETDAVCATDCIVAVANRANLDALIRNNAMFAQSLIEQLAQKINTFNKVLVNNIHSHEIQNITNEQFLYSAFVLALVSGGQLMKQNSKVIDVETDIFDKIGITSENRKEIFEMILLVLENKGSMKQINNLFDHSVILELATDIRENYKLKINQF